MKLVQITPGAGGMYCGGCFRDNALVAALRKAGHDVLMVPLYLPLTLDEPDQSADTPIFFSGINVYLEQKSALARHLPDWMLKPFTSRRLLKWAGGRAAKTRASDVGELMISMLRGEEGKQARELKKLTDWLKEHHQPEVICLSNALLVGMARRLKAELKVPVICLLSGEDAFLDGLPPEFREEAWRTLAGRSRDVDLFIAPSRYFADLMAKRLSLRPEQVCVVPNGINLQGYTVPQLAPNPPVLGYFARMCREKGLHTLVDAYVMVKQREIAKELRLHIGGGCGPTDKPFVEEQRGKLAKAGLLDQVSFFPNVDHSQKISFYEGVFLFSVPALFGEAFGLYLIEAMAAGVPVIQPRHAGFPELIEATGGGVLCEPDDVKSLADAIENLLLHPLHARHLGRRGRAAVEKDFTIERMAEKFAEVMAALKARR